MKYCHYKCDDLSRARKSNPKERTAEVEERAEIWSRRQKEPEARLKAGDKNAISYATGTEGNAYLETRSQS